MARQFKTKILLLNGAMVLVLMQLFGCATEHKSIVTAPRAVNKRVAIIETALKLQGQPYRYGGQSPVEGFDCSGLVRYVYQRNGIFLPRTTGELAQSLLTIPVGQQRQGDLVFFELDQKPFSHVGIYIGNAQFIHAPSKTSGYVMVSNLNQPYWQQRLIGVRRAINEPG